MKGDGVQLLKYLLKEKFIVKRERTLVEIMYTAFFSISADFH